MRLSSRRILLSCLLCLTLVSCQPKESAYSPAQAEQKLIAFCQKEGSVTIQTRRIKDTLWLYLGLEEPLFTTKSSNASSDSKKIPTKWHLLSLDGQFNDEQNFSFIYDLIPDVLPGDVPSYGSAYTENYTKKRQLLYQGLQESIFTLPKQEAPIFVTVMIADTTTGVATKNTFVLDDLKRLMTESLPYEEYMLRELNEVIGDKALIGDTSGRNVPYSEMTWPIFLTKQIQNRIRYKFTQSSFPPQKDPDNVIVSIVANTLRYYEFTDFQGLRLSNRRDKRDMLFSKDQLKTYEEKQEWEKQQGRLTTIHFDAGKGLIGQAPDKASPSTEDHEGRLIEEK